MYFEACKKTLFLTMADTQQTFPDPHTFTTADIKTKMRHIHTSIVSSNKIGTYNVCYLQLFSHLIIKLTPEPCVGVLQLYFSNVKSGDT